MITYIRSNPTIHELTATTILLSLKGLRYFGCKLISEAVMTSIRKYQPSDNLSATACLKKAFRDDPMFKKVWEYSNNDWDVFATECFSWGSYMLAASYDMTDVLVDNETGEIVCSAGWELPHMTVMMALRGICFMLYLLCKYSRNVS